MGDDVRTANDVSFKRAAGDCYNRALLQILQGLECSFDFTEFNPIAATLDLRIRAPHKIDQAIRSNPCQVSGLVNTVGPLLPIGEECCLVCFRVTPIAGTYANTPHVKVPYSFCQYRLQTVVQHQ